MGKRKNWNVKCDVCGDDIDLGDPTERTFYGKTTWTAEHVDDKEVIHKGEKVQLCWRCTTDLKLWMIDRRMEIRHKKEDNETSEYSFGKLPETDPSVIMKMIKEMGQ